MSQKCPCFCKRIGLLPLALLLGATIACRAPIVLPPEEPTAAETIETAASTSAVSAVGDSMTSVLCTSRVSADSDAEPSVSATSTTPPSSASRVTTKAPATTTAKTVKSSATKKTTITTRKTTAKSTCKTTTTTKKAGRPITKANLVAMINEERARIGNNVRVSYGNATLQKIANIRAEEQLRLFGHRRPMPCPGCDYCLGEKDCLSNENFWISATYGEQYAAGAWCGGFVDFWTVEDFLEHVKTSPGHYNQMFRATWTKCAYGLSTERLYMYISYGR